MSNIDQIIQIQVAPNGALIGLGSSGRVYIHVGAGPGEKATWKEIETASPGTEPARIQPVSAVPLWEPPVPPAA